MLVGKHHGSKAGGQSDWVPAAAGGGVKATIALAALVLLDRPGLIPAKD